MVFIYDISVMYNIFDYFYMINLSGTTYIYDKKHQ